MGAAVAVAVLNVVYLMKLVERRASCVTVLFVYSGDVVALYV